MLSAALRQCASTGSLPSSSFSPHSGLVLSASTNNVADEILFEDDHLLFEDDAQEEQPSPYAGSSPRDPSEHQEQHQEAEQRQQQRRRAHFQPATTLPSKGWDMPAMASRAAASAAMGMSRSMPRPISAPRLTRLAGDSDDEEAEPFVPPHLAASMVEQQFVGSISTAKGPAALRMRSNTLRRTGYLEGNMDSVAAAAGATQPAPDAAAAFRIGG